MLFANFAEALAEGRGKARADSLRATGQETRVKRLPSAEAPHASAEAVSSAELRKGQIVLVEAGDLIPIDGEAVSGVASVNESAITGESAPVIREAGGDRSSVTGTRDASSSANGQPFAVSDSVLEDLEEAGTIKVKVVRALTDWDSGATRLLVSSENLSLSNDDITSSLDNITLTLNGEIIELVGGSAEVANNPLNS